MNKSQAGLCNCGCGEAAPIAYRNRKNEGWIKGQPLRFIHGHARRSPVPEYVVDPATRCWAWLRAHDRDGYGLIDGKRAHRVVYERTKGPISAGMQLDHLCRNRLCVNPDHLEPVTARENVRRGNGTKLSPNDVAAIRRSSDAGRALAKQHGVSPALISMVRSGKRWRD